MSQNKNQAKKSVSLQSLPLIHPNAAGIDVGAKEHLVAVPADRDPKPVRSFKAFTPDLYELADWLKQCGVETVALESTGIYWISLYEILEECGFQVRVVNARHVKNVPGRTRTDVPDCQWIQKLHCFGLLNGTFRPDRQIRTLRSLMRLRDTWWSNPLRASPHMQKALFEMNVQLSNVISDIVGESGMRILEAILAGERNPEVLAGIRIKASRQTVAKSLHGDWREELLFSLQVALDSYRFTQSKIAECDARIAEQLTRFEDRASLETPPSNLKSELHRICGVDLTKIPGIKEQAAQIIISEVGLGMTCWNTEKQFSSFLGLCPNNSISGGKVLRRSTRKVYNRAADALRLCSQSLTNSKTALAAKLNLGNDLFEGRHFGRVPLENLVDHRKPSAVTTRAKIERWHKSLKADCIRPGVPLNLQDARRLVTGFVEHYNTVRLHSAIAYITPADKLAGKEEAIFAARDQKLLQARETRKTKRNQNNTHSLAATLTFSN